MRALKRLTTVTVGVETFDSLDGQGSPSYAASQDIEARVVQEDEQVVGPDGSDVRTTLTVWAEASESPLPSEKDRLTYSGNTYIGVERYEGRNFKNEITHVRLRCREE